MKKGNKLFFCVCLATGLVAALTGCVSSLIKAQENIEAGERTTMVETGKAFTVDIGDYDSSKPLESHCFLLSQSSIYTTVGFNGIGVVERKLFRDDITILQPGTHYINVVYSTGINTAADVMEFTFQEGRYYYFYEYINTVTKEITWEIRDLEEKIKEQEEAKIRLAANEYDTTTLEGSYAQLKDRALAAAADSVYIDDNVSIPKIKIIQGMDAAINLVIPVEGRVVATPKRSSNESLTDSVTDSVFEFEGVETLTITGYNGSGGIITIPSMIDGKQVTSIGPNAFKEKSLVSITIPNSVTSIGEFAFQGNQLTDVIIPDGVTSIGMLAFANNNLENIIIPNSVTTIEMIAFAGNKIKEVVIPNGIMTIEAQVFADNELTSIAIPNNVTNIMGLAFSGNPLTSITIGANVKLHHLAAGSFVNGFDNVYNSTGMGAGTYTRSDISTNFWQKQ